MALIHKTKIILYKKLISAHFLKIEKMDIVVKIAIIILPN